MRPQQKEFLFVISQKSPAESQKKIEKSGSEKLDQEKHRSEVLKRLEKNGLLRRI